MCNEKLQTQWINASVALQGISLQPIAKKIDKSIYYDI